MNYTGCPYIWTWCSSSFTVTKISKRYPCTDTICCATSMNYAKDTTFGTTLCHNSPHGKLWLVRVCPLTYSYQLQLVMWRVMAQSCAKNCVPSIIQNLYTPKHFIYILVSATCASHVLASMLNSDIRSSVEPTIAFTPII